MVSRKECNGPDDKGENYHVIKELFLLLHSENGKVSSFSTNDARKEI